ncbi:hypothetical protein [Hymenobacter mucosus]|uniref:Uncharacterized protein n=1 Tax=Hymenobacter mucosus TaxID=1411120 RepID=A0A239AUR2_9BACT|nr:hypothetical protein [Hymenobacter mucosus]SNR99446.1 hypothetical protein SAMN06269173_11562 [Hymenobacter mucosus]
MPNILEGAFEFQFPNTWHAVKYDGEKDKPAPPNYYLRHLEPINAIKAVDIVAAPPAPMRRLILLEVKDFREDDDDLQNKIETEHFPLEVVQKTLHTLSGLYLGVRAGDPELAPFGTQILRVPEELEAVLFLEQIPISRGPNDKGYKYALHNRATQRQGIARRLKNALKPLGFRCSLVDASSVPSSAGWQVV